MDDPVSEITSVIKDLTEGSPTAQRHALETYFLPSASFTHPLCRVGRFQRFSLPFFGTEICSRWVIWMIYRWYKIMSPIILLDVNSIAYDEKQQILYASVSQIFSIWFVPFYKAHVKLVVVLHLEKEQDKYFIASQEDLYQLNELYKFFWPGGDMVHMVVQWLASLGCVIATLLLSPTAWIGQRVAEKRAKKIL